MGTSRIHVLVVDDVADTADSTVELLSLWGYDAVACYDGATAVASARVRRPGVVLLDLAMPGMDGLRCARLIQGLPGCGSVPVIVVSGYWTPAYQATAREVGIRHYLLKPADPAQLEDLLAREVELSAVPSSLYEAVARHLSAAALQHKKQVLRGGRSRPRSAPLAKGSGGT